MQIKADEITKIIREEIEEYRGGVEISEIGSVISVGDGIARVYGLERAMAGELLEFPHGVMGLVLLVYYWQIWQLRRRNPTILLDPETRSNYLTRLAFGVLLVVIDGWLGGHLVYTLRLGVSA